LGYYIEKHVKWSSYQPEEKGVLIIYGSIYGHTAAAAEKMASLLAEHGVKGIAMYDASHTHVSQLVSECFRYSHVVLASSTYNAGIFTPIEDLLHDLKAHAWQNRTVAIIENGTWAAQSGKQMRTILEEMKNITILGEDISLKSAMKENQIEDMKFLADLIAVNLDIRQSDNDNFLDLGAYNSVIDNYADHTYIDEQYRALYSFDIEYRQYYTFLTKQHEDGSYDIYICLADFKQDGYHWSITNKTRVGRIRIDLKAIWNLLPIKDIDFNKRTPIREVDRKEKCIIYKLDF
jgi:flavodoxin